ncbi:MAG: hypothetical protein HY291_00715 [Planctomycetes bacterium]|nr:hypothetical protein [Planctomycetota bacterium]
MRCFSIVVLATVISAGLMAAEDIPAAKMVPEEKRKESATPDTDLRDACAIVRRLLLAMVDRDLEKIKACILESPDAGILCENLELTPEQKAEVQKGFEAMKFKRLKKGEKVYLPNGEAAIVAEIPEDRLLLQGFVGEVAMPLPFYLVKKDGTWLVDAKSLITTRKNSSEDRKSSTKESGAEKK